MLPIEKLSQYGIERENGLEDVKCIIIHNTSSSLSAREIYDYLANECKTSQGCSYIVDYNEIIQVMPDNWGAFSTGQGVDYATKYGIAIEICSNIDNEKYLLGQDKAIELIKELMNKYNIPRYELYYHNDFCKTAYCPSNIMTRYKTKKEFLDTFIN